MTENQSNSREPKRQLPWDYVDGTDVPTPGFSPQIPTPDSVELGDCLAHFFDVEFSKTGRDGRCEDCAFRRGTTANDKPATLMNAVKCLYEGEPFHCHVHEQVCAGYAALAATKRGSKPNVD